MNNKIKIEGVYCSTSEDVVKIMNIKTYDDLISYLKETNDEPLTICVEFNNPDEYNNAVSTLKYFGYSPVKDEVIDSITKDRITTVTKFETEFEFNTNYHIKADNEKLVEMLLNKLVAGKLSKKIYIDYNSTKDYMDNSNHTQLKNILEHYRYLPVKSNHYHSNNSLRVTNVSVEYILSDEIYLCPHCDYDITFMSYKDKVKTVDSKIPEIGEVNEFTCPKCKMKFCDLEINVIRVRKIG